MRRLDFISLLSSAVALPAVSRVAMTQVYPSRPVRLIVGFPGGTTGDILIRLMGQWLSDRLGQPFIIENRPGAAGNVATEQVVRAAPDGYTLLLAVPANAINASLYDKLNFNFIDDIVPVAGVARSAFVMAVTPSVPAKTVPEFIAYAKANPGKINMASFGTGTLSHVSGELFVMRAGVDMLHVPYRGSWMPDLLAGQVQVVFGAISIVIDNIRTGKLRALAVTSAMRSDALPDVPLLGEFLPVGGGRDVQCGVARIYVVLDLVDVIRLRHLAGCSILKMSFRQARLFLEQSKYNWIVGSDDRPDQPLQFSVRHIRGIN